jgi:TPR repeat protein
MSSESAAKGDALGAFNLARCYENATGAPQRFKFLFQRQSVHDALGTETDIAKALQYYKISAKRGWADAYVM